MHLKLIGIPFYSSLTVKEDCSKWPGPVIIAVTGIFLLYACFEKQLKKCMATNYFGPRVVPPDSKELQREYIDVEAPVEHPNETV